MLSPNATSYVQQQYATSANLDARIALHLKFSTATEHFHDWLFDSVQLPPAARVLELGCGSGAMWQHVAPRVPPNWQLTLSDFSFGMASTARVNLNSLISNLSFLQSDAQAISFADETFDGIFANHMLYHVPNLNRTLSEIRRVLKPGGTLYAATNGGNHMRELGELVTKVTGEPPRSDAPETLFGLENGAARLAPYFENVTLEIQPNDLRVTEVQPLVDYANSGLFYKAATSTLEREQLFRAYVQREIDTRGCFFITRAVGLFIATNGRASCEPVSP